MSAKPKSVFLVGPTAIGKTATAIRLAKALKTEIVSADSRQFYREMSIGTAKPTSEEQAAVKHHFIDFLSIGKDYSAGQFERDALAFLNRFFTTHQHIVITGGSGLYLNAVANGFDELPSDTSIRKSLNIKLKQEGIEVLQAQLKELDSEHFQRIDLQNPQRLIRALEVCLCSGRPYSAYRQDAAKPRNFDPIWMGMEADRSVLYDRINRRVDLMIEGGLIEEARELLPFRHLNALNTVGYKELFAYFDGEYSRNEAVEKIKQHTRNFAKRQITWFKKNPQIKWFNFDQTQEMIDYATEQCKA